MVDSATITGQFNMIENYIYIYPTDTWIVLPTYPDNISDTVSANFNKSTPLLRTAPIYSYASSGPRSVKFDITLHRDMMTQINYLQSNAKVEMGDDYVDTMIGQLQSIAFPSYGASAKLVDPPLIALRIGNEVFIKGVVDGSISVEYNLPILENNKYAMVRVAFDVTEVDPYDAQQVMQNGSLRGINTTLDRSLYKAVRAPATVQTGRFSQVAMTQ